MANTNKRLLISESHDDLNRCTPCRGKPNQHDAYTSTQPATGGGLLAQVLGTWPGRGHRALRGRHGAGSEGSPVAYTGTGGRCEYEESARDALGKKKCATAHQGSRASTRRQSRGWMAAFRQWWMARGGRQRSGIIPVRQ
jgi:hypothetical protein